MKIGAKRLYNHAHPSYEFEEHLMFRQDQKRNHKTAKDRERRYFGKKVRRMLKKFFHEEIRNNRED